MTNFARRNFGVELGRHFGGLFLIRVVLVVVAEVSTRYLGCCYQNSTLCFSAGKFLVFFFGVTLWCAVLEEICCWCWCWGRSPPPPQTALSSSLSPSSLHIIRVHMQYYPTHTTLYCIVHFIPTSSYPHFFELQTII